MGAIDKSKSLPKYKMLENLGKEYQKQIAKHAQRLVDAANKRLRRMEQAKVMSPAYYAAMNGGGYFSGRGFSKDYNQLMHEYSRVIAFLNNETSTLGGARKYEKKISALLGNREITMAQRDLIFEVFHKLEEMDVLGSNLYYRDLFEYISDNVASDKALAISQMARDSAEYQRAVDENLQTAKEYLSQIYDSIDNMSIPQSAFRKIK